jgi:hypothetical protein
LLPAPISAAFQALLSRLLQAKAPGIPSRSLVSSEAFGFPRKKGFSGCISAWSLPPFFRLVLSWFEKNACPLFIEIGACFV